MQPLRKATCLLFANHPVRQQVSNSAHLYSVGGFTVLTGPPNSGKSSLAFQYACGLVKRGQTVVYISTHRKFAPGADSLPTFPEDAAAPVSDLLDKIQMMYFDDESSIINFLSDLHNKPLPDVIILDDAQDMIHASKDRFASYIRIIAFAKEAADYLATAKPKRDSTPTDNMDFSGDDDEEHELNNNDGLCDCGILFVDSTVGTEVEQHKKAETLRRWFSSSITVSAIQGQRDRFRVCVSGSQAQALAYTTQRGQFRWLHVNVVNKNTDN